MVVETRQMLRRYPVLEAEYLPDTAAILDLVTEIFSTKLGR